MTLPPSASKPPQKSGGKKLFLRGLALLLPTIVTLIILIWGFGVINDYLVGPVNRVVNAVVDATGFEKVDGTLLPDGTRAKADHAWPVQWFVVAPLSWFLRQALGFLLTILFIGLAGLAVGTLIGRRLWNAAEKRLTRLPLVRFVYPFIREVTDFVFTEDKVAFRSVVLVQYPRPGLWSIGFRTGEGFDAIEKGVGRPLVSVFLPASPTPMTGYVVFVPEEDVTALDISIDDAFRLIMSGGVIVPGAPDARPAAAPGAPVRQKSQKTH